MDRTHAVLGNVAILVQHLFHQVAYFVTVGQSTRRADITGNQDLLVACDHARQGLINALDVPTRQSFVIELVERRRISAIAIALNSSMVHSARLFGPAIAGYLIYRVGEGYCFLIDGFSYLAVIGALLAIRVVRRAARADKTSGLGLVRRGDCATPSAFDRFAACC